MTEQEVLTLFREANALLEGHFLLTSGLHSGHYFEKFALLQHPRKTEELCRALADRFRARGPSRGGTRGGGILLAHEVGKHLGTRAIFHRARGWADGPRRGFAIAPGERVLVVEDVVTTGGSVREVLDVVTAAGGEVVGVALLVDRSGGTVDFGVPLRSALDPQGRSYPPDQCPLCRARHSFDEPGQPPLLKASGGQAAQFPPPLALGEKPPRLKQ